MRVRKAQHTWYRKTVYLSRAHDCGDACGVQIGCGKVGSRSQGSRSLRIGTEGNLTELGIRQVSYEHRSSDPAEKTRSPNQGLVSAWAMRFRAWLAAAMCLFLNLELKFHVKPGPGSRNRSTDVQVAL